jgi:hypothetical protein
MVPMVIRLIIHQRKPISRRITDDPRALKSTSRSPFAHSTAYPSTTIAQWQRHPRGVDATPRGRATVDQNFMRKPAV